MYSFEDAHNNKKPVTMEGKKTIPPFERIRNFMREMMLEDTQQSLSLTPELVRLYMELEIHEKTELLNQCLLEKNLYAVLLFSDQGNSSVFDPKENPKWKELFPDCSDVESIVASIEEYVDNSDNDDSVLIGYFWMKWKNVFPQRWSLWKSSQKYLTSITSLLNAYGIWTKGGGLPIDQSLINEVLFDSSVLTKDEWRLIDSSSIFGFHKLMVNGIVTNSQYNSALSKYAATASPSEFAEIYSAGSDSNRALLEESHIKILQDTITSHEENLSSGEGTHLLDRYLSGEITFLPEYSDRLLGKCAKNAIFPSAIFSDKLPDVVCFELFCNELLRGAAGAENQGARIAVESMIDDGSEKMGKSKKIQKLLVLIEKSAHNYSRTPKETRALLVVSQCLELLNSQPNKTDTGTVSILRDTILSSQSLARFVHVASGQLYASRDITGSFLKQLDTRARTRLFETAIDNREYQFLGNYLGAIKVAKWQLSPEESVVFRMTESLQKSDKISADEIDIIQYLLDGGAGEGGDTYIDKMSDQIAKLDTSERWRYAYVTRKELLSLTETQRAKITYEFWEAIEAPENEGKMLLGKNSESNYKALLYFIYNGATETVKANAREVTARLKKLISMTESIGASLMMIDSIMASGALSNEEVMDVLTAITTTITDQTHIRLFDGILRQSKLEGAQCENMLKKFIPDLSGLLGCVRAFDRAACESAHRIEGEQYVRHLIDLTLDGKVHEKYILNPKVVSNSQGYRQDEISEYYRSKATPEYIGQLLAEDGREDFENLITVITIVPESTSTYVRSIKKQPTLKDVIKLRKLIPIANNQEFTELVEQRIVHMPSYARALCTAVGYIDTIVNNSEILPPELQKKLVRFSSLVGSNKYRELVSLLIIQLSHIVNFDEVTLMLGLKLDYFIEILSSMDITKLPSDLVATTGLEFEATNSCALGMINHMRIPMNHGNSTAVNVKAREIINFLTEYADIGRGLDAVYEVATEPSISPYVILLEIHLLQNIGVLNFNFNGLGYETAARGIHTTISSKEGIPMTAETHMIQNILALSDWTGINAGNDVSKSARGRGVASREKQGSLVVDLFDEPGVNRKATELRSNSVDKVEPFERAFEFTYLCAIAVNQLIKYTGKNKLPEHLVNLRMEQYMGASTVTRENLFTLPNFRHIQTKTETEKKIIGEFLILVLEIYKAIKDHNDNFFENETSGYVENDEYNDPADWGGAGNLTRIIEEVTRSRDIEKLTQGKKTSGELLPVSQVREWVRLDTKINTEWLFEDTPPELLNAVTHAHNLFSKTSIQTSIDELGRTVYHRVGDQVNNLAILSTTKLPNGEIEDSGGLPVETSIFQKPIEREGYYSVQGASPKFISHQVQIAMLEFRKNMRAILKDEMKKKHE